MCAQGGFNAGCRHGAASGCQLQGCEKLNFFQLAKYCKLTWQAGPGKHLHKHLACIICLPAKVYFSGEPLLIRINKTGVP